MPPHVPRKRHKSKSPVEASRPAKRQNVANRDVARHRKVAEVVKDEDFYATTSNTTTAAESKKYLDSLEDSEDSSSSNSSVDDFEDVLPVDTSKDTPMDSDDEDDFKWEDVHIPEGPTELKLPVLTDISITLDEPEEPDSTKGKKKGPTKQDRQRRIQSHCLHVLSLMWANTIRNSWLCDKELHQILLGGLPEGIQKEITQWRISSGLEAPPPAKNKTKSTQNRKGKGKKSNVPTKNKDWGAEAARAEPGVPNMSAGDPLLRLLKYLVSYWKQRFTVTTPSLHKQGYRRVRERDTYIKAFRANHDKPNLFGERVKSLEEFRALSKKCRGSSDVGAHLFTALLRAIGIETRMICSLQPTGFGWSQSEEGTKFDSKALKEAAALGSSSKQPIELSDSEPRNADSTRNPITRPKPKRLASDSGSELSDISSGDLDSDLELLGSEDKPTNSNARKTGKIVAYPTYWSEVLSPITNTYIPVSIFTTPSIASKKEYLNVFEPRGTIADKDKLVICYVVAHSQDGTAKDVTVRYLKKHQLPGRTKGYRMPPEKVPIYNKHGKIAKYAHVDWFERVMTIWARRQQKRTIADDIEDQGDLVPFKPVKETADDKPPETLQGYKSSTEFVLERHLRREEALLPSAQVVRQFQSGKGDKAKEEPVYLRKDVVNCKTAESWHKEGREIKLGEDPYKRVPIRAVTLLRKQEVEQATRHTGEKPLQGLYARDQTRWIIPPPIQNGIIPRNAYGNIDIYVPSMVPQGAVHLPYRGLKKVCKQLEIDFAEACTGFEFGHQMAVPVISGVVIAEEHEEAVIDAWNEAEERRVQREEAKQKSEALKLWRKFLTSLRILERVKREYARTDDGLLDEKNPFTIQKQKETKAKPTKHHVRDHDVDDESVEGDDSGNGEGGGFIPEGMQVEISQRNHLEVQDEDHVPALSKAKENTKAKPMSLRTALIESESDSDENEIPVPVKKAQRGSRKRAMSSEDEDESSKESSASEEYEGFRATGKRGSKQTVTTSRLRKR